MKTTKTLTFEEGCNKYLEYCQQRNLRQGTINHYKQSYTQFYKFFDPEMPLEEIDESAYKTAMQYAKKWQKHHEFYEYLRVDESYFYDDVMRALQQEISGK